MLLQQYNIGLGYDRAHISGFQYKLCAVRWNTHCLSVLKIFRVQFNVKAILLCRILCNLSRALHAIQPTSRSNGLIMCRHCFLASDRFAKRFIENAVCNKIRSMFKSVLFFFRHFLLRIARVGWSCTTWYGDIFELLSMQNNRKYNYTTFNC